MKVIQPLITIPLGIVAERRTTNGPWVDTIWRPASILLGTPDTAAWTKLTDDGERATFYVGEAVIELYRTEVSNYRDNLMMESPLVWVSLQETGGDPPYGSPNATVDPAEGEAFASAAGVITETLPMPDLIRAHVDRFVAEYYVERAFSKRKRDRANLEAMGWHKPERLK